MNEIQHTPELRFDGFTEPWGQQKLSSLVSMHARIGWQNLRASEFLESGEFLLITGTDFVDGTVNYNCCHYVDKSRYDQDPNIQVKNGNILLTKDGTLGKVAFVQGLSKPATLNAGVFNIVVKDLAVIDSRYLFHYLRGSFLMDYVDKNATGGTIKHLNQNILVDFPVLLPPIHEQRMLGITLSKIDSLITLQQRKYERLQHLKQALLRKMFPKPGELVPELRFDGFTEPWKERKLGDIAIIVAGGDANKRRLRPAGKYPVIANALTNDGIVGYYDDSYRIEAPAVTVTGRGEVGHAKARFTPFTPVVRLLAIVTKSDVSFIAEAINLTNIALESTGVPQLTVPQLASVQLRIPDAVEEQQAIGTFFHKLDSLIALHQREYERLKRLKQALLRKMFV